MLKSQISRELGIPMDTLETLAVTASHRYKRYNIPKRSGRGFRMIEHPARELKAVQRWLLRAVIDLLPVHDSAKAYKAGVGVRDNARLHAGSRYLLRMDFRDFFPSITDVDIGNYIAANSTHFAGWEAGDISWFRLVVCRNGRLTIGAPTSPGLSNALCYKLDHQIASVCAEVDVVYTRYADDMFFSTRARDVLGTIELNVHEIVNGLDVPGNLRINDDKTLHSSKRGKRVVTGLVLTSDGRLSIGRQKKRYIRSLLHKYETLNDLERRRLAGTLAFVRDVEPSFIDSLVLKYTAELVNEALRFETVVAAE